MIVPRVLIIALAFSASVGPLNGQTAIDLRTQSKSIDFSGAAFTKPSKSGTTLPAVCTVGETFFKTDAPLGANLYGCTSTNVWTQIGQPGTVGGDLSGPLSSASVVGLRSRAMSATAPANKQCYKWVNSTNQFEPLPCVGSIVGGVGIVQTSVEDQVTLSLDTADLPFLSGDNQWGGVNDFSSASRTQPHRSDTTDPTGACSAGETYLNIATGTLWVCKDDLTWGQGGTTVTLAGDVVGLASNATVARIRGIDVHAAVPTDGQVLGYSAANSRWEPADPPAGSGAVGYDLVEHFCGGKMTNGDIGELGWSYINGSQPSPIAPSSSEPFCGVHRMTGATPVISGFRLGEWDGCTLHSSGDFRVDMWVKPTSAGSDALYRFGFLSSNSNPPADGIWIGKEEADTTWQAVTRASLTETKTDLGVAVSTASIQKLTIRNSNGTIYFSIDGGAETSQTTNVPSTGLQISFQMRNPTAADIGANLYAVKLQLPSLP